MRKKFKHVDGKEDYGIHDRSRAKEVSIEREYSSIKMETTRRALISTLARREVLIPKPQRALRS